MEYKKKNQKNKKKKFQPKEWNNILAIGDNAIDTSIQKRKRYDINKILYFIYNKKGYYSSNCTKPKN